MFLERQCDSLPPYWNLNLLPKKDLAALAPLGVVVSFLANVCSSIAASWRHVRGCNLSCATVLPFDPSMAAPAGQRLSYARGRNFAAIMPLPSSSISGSLILSPGIWSGLPAAKAGSGHQDAAVDASRSTAGFHCLPCTAWALIAVQTMH